MPFASFVDRKSYGVLYYPVGALDPIYQTHLLKKYMTAIMKTLEWRCFWEESIFKTDYDNFYPFEIKET